MNTNVKENSATIDSPKKRTQVMVVADKSDILKELVQLVEGQSDFDVCAEAKSVDEILKAFEEKQIDFTIVCTFSEDLKSNQLVKEIKLGCPNLPLLMCSMSEEMLARKRSLKKVDSIINQKKAEEIIEAIHYVKTLLKDNIFGFAVLVNVE